MTNKKDWKKLCLEAIDKLIHKYETHSKGDLSIAGCALCDLYQPDTKASMCKGCPNTIFEKGFFMNCVERLTWGNNTKMMIAFWKEAKLYLETLPEWAFNPKLAIKCNFKPLLKIDKVIHKHFNK